MSVFLAICAIILLTLVKVYMEWKEANNRKAIIDAFSPADSFSDNAESLEQPYLLLHHNLSGRIYQVYCGEREYLFHDIGGEFKGIDSQKRLMDYIPSVDEFETLPGKNFRIEKQSIDRLIIKPKTIQYTYMPNSAILSFYTPKKSKYILLNELPDEQLLWFFRDVRSRVSFDEKALMKREKKRRQQETERTFDEWRESQQNPRVFRCLYTVTILLFILEIVAFAGIFFCLKSGLRDGAWSFLSLLCHVVVVLLGLAFPAYFTMRSKPPLDVLYDWLYNTESKSISMHNTLVFSGIGAFWALLRTEFFPLWSILVSGLIYALVLVVLFILRFRELRQKSLSLLGALFFGVIFCLGVPAQANCLFDFSEPQMTTAVVVRKINNSFLVGVDLRFEDGNVYYWDLSKKQYEAVRWGDKYEFEMHSGAFHMKYARW